jgi:hypothetical protein
MTDPLRNPQDPLRKVGPEKQMELFRVCARAANGYTTDDVLAVSLVMLVNALRQTHSTRRQAEQRYDELMARYKSVLLNHYDLLGNRKHSIFPFDQIITPRPFK